MKTKNVVIMLVLAVSGLAHAKTWDERKVDTKARLNLTHTGLVTALGTLTSEITKLKLDREDHKNYTSETIVKADHALEALSMIENKFNSTTLVND